VTRLHALAAHPRRTLAALAVVLAAVGITVGSGANFTASSANAGNVFTTGTLVIAKSSNSALLNMTNLKPGDTANSTVDIQNTGTVAGDFTIKTANATGSSALLGQVDLTVADCGVFSGSTPPSCSSPTTKYSGKVSGLTGSALGTYAGGAQHRYVITATLPGSTNDTFQGLTAGTDFVWSATTT
jgi:hypothetical protein